MQLKKLECQAQLSKSTNFDKVTVWTMMKDQSNDNPNPKKGKSDTKGPQKS